MNIIREVVGLPDFNDQNDQYKYQPWDWSCRNMDTDYYPIPLGIQSGVPFTFHKNVQICIEYEPTSAYFPPEVDDTQQRFLVRSWISFDQGKTKFHEFLSYGFRLNHPEEYKSFKEALKEIKKKRAAEKRKIQRSKLKEKFEAEALELGLPVRDYVKQKFEEIKEKNKTKKEILATKKSIEETEKLMRISKALISLESQVESLKQKIEGDSSAIDLRYLNDNINKINTATFTLKIMNGKNKK